MSNYKHIIMSTCLVRSIFGDIVVHLATAIKIYSTCNFEISL